MVLELARCEYIPPHSSRRQSVGPAAALSRPGGLPEGPLGRLHHRRRAGPRTIEARDDKQLLRFQKKLATYKLLIVDELGFVPLSKPAPSSRMFEVFSQRYERGSTLVTTNLPFDEWTEVFGSERLTGALLDRLTHHVNILEIGDSYRLNQSRRRQTPTANCDPVGPQVPPARAAASAC